MKPAIFLDRDNTLINNDGDLGSPDAVRLCDGVPNGLLELRDAGYALIVVTNQGGVARGVYTEADVDAVHQRIATMVDEESDRTNLIDRFYYCPYHPEAEIEEYRREHPWRKPNPGMLLQAAHDMHIDLGQSWMIGDQVRDMEAGRSAGCRTALVTQMDDLAEKVKPTVVTSTFDEAVQEILKQKPRPNENTPENGLSMTSLFPTSQSTSAPTTTSHAMATEAPKAMDSANSEIASLRRVVHDLTDELRSERLRRAEFTFWKMGAVFCQLLTLLMALLGLLQVGQPDMDIFIKWMLGAALAQMITITLMLVDHKG
ncbi:MAG: HAD family hydrolase [Planctomycetota bacterium]|nr:HAD family hydrolase [Planctomycetota bacterium]